MLDDFGKEASEKMEKQEQTLEIGERRQSNEQQQRDMQCDKKDEKS